jgi:uncharacterized protein (TIGR02453 family)
MTTTSNPMIQQSTLQFFRELRQNNNKPWFDLNRARYEEVKKDYHHLAAILLQRMQSVEPALAHLQVKDCIFRINRDIRFSQNKEPYKTHMGIIMTPFGKRMEYAGYYLHIDEAEGSFVGGGLYMPTSEALRKVRVEISNFFEDFQAIIHLPSFRSTYQDLDRENGMVLKRPPKGYSDDNPAIEYLKFKSFTATCSISSDQLTNPNTIEKVVAILKDLKPFIDFLNQALREN